MNILVQARLFVNRFIKKMAGELVFDHAHPPLARRWANKKDGQIKKLSNIGQL
jgi:hypothetical protein